ncbi:MAG: flagellar L-ring protein precursor FlgH [Phycisphaerales bacterium]|jgi:flagellar L-ring protein precursor FlgH
MNPTPPTTTTLITLATAILLATGTARAQNLYAAQPARAAPTDRDENTAPDPGSVSALSMIYVEPPEEREIQAHDIISILIDENSNVKSEQTLDTNKEFDTSATLGTILDPWELLELRLRTGAISDLELINAQGDRQYTGEGEYERKDKFTARIAATVLEVKPNGTLVLEARKRIAKDEEEQVLVLSGRIRQEDVTAQNTVLSSQIAELTIVMQNEGEVRSAAKKGLITRVLDSIFAF